MHSAASATCFERGDRATCARETMSCRWCIKSCEARNVRSSAESNRGTSLFRRVVRRGCCRRDVILAVDGHTRVADRENVAEPSAQPDPAAGQDVTNAPHWDRVKLLFQEAFERPPRERFAWLRSRCGNDRALAAEVESLLVTHEQAGSFGELPALELLSAINADSGTAVAGPAVRPGDRLGVYEIRALLGAGRAAFAGDTVSDCIAAILERETDWSASRRAIHRIHDGRQQVEENRRLGRFGGPPR